MTKIPELYPFQKIGVFRATRKFKGRVLLCDDVGLGKTAESLHTAEYFYDPELGPIVVACPNSVKYQWEMETRKHLGWRSWVLNGLSPPPRLPLNIPPIIILNWDILRGGWTDRLIMLRPQTVIGDEIHRIKDGRAQCTKAFRRLCIGVPQVLGLSGTPIENSPIDFFNILNILRKDEFPAFRPFAFRYSIPKITPWGVQYRGSANTEELNRRLLSTCMIRRTKEEVLTDLPPITRITIPVDIDWDEYEEAEKNFLGWLFKQNPGKAMRVRNAIHLTKLQMLLGLVAKLKTPAIIEWIKEFIDNSDRKLVMFGHHRSFLEELKQSFDKKSVLVYGGITGQKRHNAIDQFANDKKTRIFFGSILAMGTGVNKLQTVCSDVAMGEYIWTGTKLLQAEGRLHRLGQKYPVTAYYLVAKNTAETILLKALHSKQSIVNALVDGKPDKQEFDILEKVFQKMRKRK